MATTTNFGWETPDDTDLVKDGAAAIRTALGGVDTSFVDLKGGTTGQVLAKASGTDLDFSWVAQDDSNAIQNAIVDAKGDLIAATANDTPARLGVGTNGQILTADSTAATGLAWATLSASRGLNQIIPSSVAVGSGTATVGANGKISLSGVGTNISINGVFSSTYTNYHIVYDLISASSHTALNMRLRASGTDNTSSTSYKTGGLDSSIPFAVSGLSSQTSDSDKFSKLGWVGSVSINGGTFDIFQPFLTSKTTYVGSHFGNAAGDWYYSAGGGSHNVSASYDGFSLLTTQSLTGAIYIYGWQE